MVCQPIAWWEAAPADCVSAAICFASCVGWSNSLVKKDQMEVSSLSRGVCFISSPSHCRMAFAFSFFLCPQSHHLPFPFSFPMSGRLRIYHVLLTYHEMA